MGSTRKLIVNNVFWKYMELFSVMGVQLLCTSIMARFLSPEDFGILGVIIVFTSLGDIFVISGFVQTLIREKEVTRTDYSTVFYFNIGVAILLYVIFFFLSRLIVEFYGRSDLVTVFRVAFLVLPLNALSIVQLTKLQREVKFKKIFFITFISSLLSASLAIGIVLIYKNIWALVIQIVASYIFKNLLFWLTTDFIPELKFSYATFKRYFQFSKNLLVSGLIGTIFNNIYSLIIGKVYSVSELGYYSQASRFNNLASHTTTQVVQSVTYPILSKLNNEKGDIKDAYKKITGVTIIVVGFAMSLLMSCALDFFEIFFGNPLWRIAGVYFLLIGINGILFPLHCINQNILLVKGDSKTILFLEIVRRCLMTLVILVTMNFNILVFVSGLSIYSILLLFLNLYYCGRPIQYSVREQLYDTLPIFARLILMILLAHVTTHFLSIDNVYLRLIVSCSICLVVGVIMFWRQSDFQNLCAVFRKTYK